MSGGQNCPEIIIRRYQYAIFLRGTIKHPFIRRRSHRVFAHMDRIVAFRTKRGREFRGECVVDQEFHAALYAPCRQARTLGLIENLRGSVNRFYYLYLSPESFGPDCIRNHRRILKACQKKDADGAVAAIEKHLKSALREVEVASRG